MVWITEALKTASGQLMDTFLRLACASENNAQTSWHLSPLTREVDAIVFLARTSQNPSQRLILRRVTLALLRPGKIDAFLTQWK